MLANAESVVIVPGYGQSRFTSDWIIVTLALATQFTNLYHLSEEWPLRPRYGSCQSAICYFGHDSIPSSEKD